MGEEVRCNGEDKARGQLWELPAQPCLCNPAGFSVGAPPLVSAGGGQPARLRGASANASGEMPNSDPAGSAAAPLRWQHSFVPIPA